MGREKKKAREKRITTKKRDRMVKILSELKRKLKEIDKLREEIEKETPEPISSTQARAMLEEIKVPPLELISESKRKK